MRKGLTSFLGAILITLAGCASVDTARPLAEDWPEPQAPWERLERGATPPADGWEDDAGGPRGLQSGAGIFDLGFRFYVRGLTEMDGPRCEHRPTCSVYAFRSVRKHGMLMGSFMSVDRLMRGNRSSALRRLPIYRVYDGKIYYYDPVEANDFFL